MIKLPNYVTINDSCHGVGCPDKEDCVRYLRMLDEFKAGNTAGKQYYISMNVRPHYYEKCQGFIGTGE